MSNDTHRAFSSVAVVLAIGAIGGMALVGYASKPHAAAPIVITLPAPAPVPAPVPVAAAPVAAAPVAAVAPVAKVAPAVKAKRKVVVRKVVVRTVPAAVIYYRAAPACSCML